MISPHPRLTQPNQGQTSASGSPLMQRYAGHRCQCLYARHCGGACPLPTTLLCRCEASCMQSQRQLAPLTHCLISASHGTSLMVTALETAVQVMAGWQRHNETFAAACLHRHSLNMGITCPAGPTMGTQHGFAC